ncbi:MAG: LacI family transcriptional regulator [Anaerolineae bacterium]|nr:LacI family transcriptional regulator [Anaerolineae bacterium]
MDIAVAAGVAPSTVSRALQDHPRISPERRAQIKALAEQMGYRPNQVARSLVTGRSHTLGVVVTEVTDPFVAEVMRGAELASREAGYTLLFASSDRDPARELEAIRLLLAREVEGVIVISGRAGAHYSELRSSGQLGAAWPLILLNNQQAGAGIYSVRMDNRAGAIAALSYLKALGHRRIAFVAGPERGRSSRERLESYRQGLAANGLGSAAELVVSGAGLLEDGPRALAALMALAERPTAVLCYNDLAALGLLGAAARAGLHVPADLSVVGYDNIPLSAFSVPPLTTVDQPKERMGRLAVEMCLAALDGRPAQDVVLRGELVIRESAAPPNLSS